MSAIKERDDIVSSRTATVAIVPILFLLLGLPFACLQVKCAEIAKAPQCTLAVFNIGHRETGKVIVNSGPIGLFSSDYVGPFNLTPELKPGKNTLHIQFFQMPGPVRPNSFEGWSYGYSISIDGKEIASSECGFADKISCTAVGGLPDSLGSASGTVSSNKLVYDSTLQILYFSILRKIPVMRQHGDSGWACLASVLFSWRLARFVSPSEIAGIGGPKYKHLLAAGLPLKRRELADFCQKVALKIGSVDHATPSNLIELLGSRGPLWLAGSVGSAAPVSFSNQLLCAVAGDGTAERTYLSLIDPKGGRQHYERFSELIANGGVTRVSFISAK